MTTKTDSLRPSYSVGQLAKRWGVGAERIKRLVETGKLPGAFTIPSAGRYGKAVRIPSKTVREVEDAWSATLANPTATRPDRKRQPPPLTLKHFPELAEPADGSP